MIIFSAVIILDHDQMKCIFNPYQYQYCNSILDTRRNTTYQILNIIMAIGNNHLKEP